MELRVWESEGKKIRKAEGGGGGNCRTIGYMHGGE